jgi:cell wall-associated NlpC family hydrolase
MQLQDSDRHVSSPLMTGAANPPERSAACAAPRRNSRSFLFLLAVSVALTACSTISGPTPERDRLMDGRGPQPDEPEAQARASRVGQRAANVAIKYRGALYQWGSAGPFSFDCSGFVQYVYAQVGVSLPHNVAMQYGYGIPISRDRLQPGDVVFFDRLRHNGIYIGEGRFIHARQTGRRINVGTLDEDWYRSRWVGARRL